MLKSWIDNDDDDANNDDDNDDANDHFKDFPRNEPPPVTEYAIQHTQIDKKRLPFEMITNRFMSFDHPGEAQRQRPTKHTRFISTQLTGEIC